MIDWQQLAVLMKPYVKETLDTKKPDGSSKELTRETMFGQVDFSADFMPNFRDDQQKSW